LKSPSIAAGYFSAQGHTLYLPATVAVFGLITSLFLTRTRTRQPGLVHRESVPQPVA
jgi:hypothetical protein